MDVLSIQAALSSLKTAGDIAKGFMEMKQFAEVSGEVMKLNVAILAAQRSAIDANASHSEQVDAIRELEKEIVRLKDWNADKIRYKLVAVVDGAFAYAVQEAVCNSEPPHYVCASCYNAGQKSILQRSFEHERRMNYYYSCSKCRERISVYESTKPEYA